MTDHEAKQREARQRRALAVKGGAQIESHYVNRTTKVVGVTEADLQDLLSIDAVELALLGLGQFMASGALWLFLDKYMDPDFTWNALTGFCAASFLFGAILVGAGYFLRSMKRAKIKRIFQETGSASLVS